MEAKFLGIQLTIFVKCAHICGHFTKKRQHTFGFGTFCFFCGGGIVRIPPPPPPSLGDGGRGLSHFSEHLYRRDLGQIGILGENWHFRWG